MESKICGGCRSPCLDVSYVDGSYVPSWITCIPLFVDKPARVCKPVEAGSGPLGNEIRRNLIYTRDFVPAHSPVAGCVKEFLIELAHLASELE